MIVLLVTAGGSIDDARMPAHTGRDDIVRGCAQNGGRYPAIDTAVS